ITDMQESAMFSENEKSEMFELYKKLMIMHNSSLLLEISSDEKKEAEFIAETAKEWDSIKKKMTNVVENMKESWRKEIKLTDDIGYLG
ncbi:MAG: hypothetical protein KKE20_01600, partial [Nanoarchaeota archaeon]|nr:hypothetical protein [Nanoarchaeota archaeon]